MQPSIQQQALIEWFNKDVTGSVGACIVKARAGCGKTTAGLMLVEANPKPSLYIAFGKDIATEVDSKVKAAKLDQRVKVGTVHSVGFAAWRYAANGVKLNTDKLWNLTVAHFSSQPDMVDKYAGFLVKLISMAKQCAFGVVVPVKSEEAWLELVDRYDLADDLTGNTDDWLLKRLVQDAQQIYGKSLKACYREVDFDDMLLAPLYYNARFRTYPLVILDEAQDTNPARREIARRSVATGGRLVALGDDKQAIFAWTGADSNSLELIKQTMNAAELPLNVTYRCPKMVVKEAQQFVSDLTAHENNSEGAVRRIDSEEIFAENLTAADVIICRNNAPLISMAYQLLRRKIACHVRGRDIGVGLISLANRWKFHSFDNLEGHLETYLQREKAKAIEAKQENRAQSVEDKVETLRVFINAARCDGISTLAGLIKMIRDLFEDDQSNRKPTLALSTVHKAKGKEWPRVYLLGRDQLMPSKWANSDWQIEQENNLIYVAITRAMKELIYVDLPC